MTTPSVRAAFKASLAEQLEVLGLRYVAVNLGRDMTLRAFWTFAVTDGTGAALGRRVYVEDTEDPYSDEVLERILEAARSFIRGRP